MDDSQRAEFAEVWTATMELYQRDVSPFAIELAFKALSHMSLEDVRVGLSGHVRNPDTGQYPPKPADVIRHVHGSSETTAMLAWSKVEQAVRQVGPWRTVVFDDHKIHAAIERLGGWIKVAETSEQEFPFLRNHFVKLYEGFTVAPPKRYPHQLLGIADHANSHQTFQRGRPIPQLTVIGDRDKARQVYRMGYQDAGQPVHHAETLNRLGAPAKRLENA